MNEKISILAIDGPNGEKAHIALSQLDGFGVEKTHCGATSENWYFGGHICSTEPKAVLKFAKECSDIPLCSECMIFLLARVPPKVETIGRESTPEEIAAVTALANSGGFEIVVEDWASEQSEHDVKKQSVDHSVSAETLN